MVCARGGLVDDGLLEVLVVIGGERVGGLPDIGWRGHPGRDVVKLRAGRPRSQPLFLDSALELVAAALERLVDGLRAGRQPALQGGQREADGAFACAVL
jgi:hypothetical protein